MESDNNQTTGWALFYIGGQVSKSHSTKEAAMIEAYERGVVTVSRGRSQLARGYTILEAAHVE
jgi:hypothetical protein